MTDDVKLDISKRYIDVVDTLIKDGKIRSYKAFAESIGVKPQSLNDIKATVSGGNTLNRYVTIEMIYNTCLMYEISLKEIFYDKSNYTLSDYEVSVVEEMAPKMASKVASNHGKQNETTHKNETTHPSLLLNGVNSITYVPAVAQAGFLTGFSQEPILPLPKFSLPGLEKGNYVAFNMEGDSMYPTLTNGDILITKQLEDIRWARNGEIYVLHIKNDGLLVKRIEKNPKEKVMAIISDNDFYKPDEIQYDDIQGIYQVKRCITDNLGPKNLKEKEIVELYKEIKKLSGK